MGCRYVLQTEAAISNRRDEKVQSTDEKGKPEGGGIELPELAWRAATPVTSQPAEAGHGGSQRGK